MTDDKDLLKIKNLLDSEPSQFEVAQWKSALRKKTITTARSKIKPWMQWTAAALLGFLIGAATFYKTQPDWLQDVAAVNNFDEDATIEHVYINSD